MQDMPIPDIDSVDVTPLLDAVNAYLKSCPLSGSWLNSFQYLGQTEGIALAD